MPYSIVSPSPVPPQFYHLANRTPPASYVPGRFSVEAQKTEQKEKRNQMQIAALSGVSQTEDWTEQTPKPPKDRKETHSIAPDLALRLLV
jgi:hypothetical protein